MTELLIFVHLAILIGFTIRILLRDDLSPQARLAWFILIAALPYVGSAIYFLFGEIDLGHHANKRHREVLDQIHSKAAPLFGTPAETDRLIDPLYSSAFRYAGSINGFHAVDGNRAELMADAAETNARLIADIDAAQSHVYVLYYIWLDDTTGTDIARALIRAAERGVICRAMADGLGSRAFIRSSLWQRMKEAGVLTATALPLDNLIRTVLTSRIDLRNHRKITVIDSKITYCGSRNSADPEFRIKARYAPWVDIMLRFEGAIVAQNELLFISDWMQPTGEKFEDFNVVPHAIQGGFPAQVMGDGPTERRGATPQLFSALIACARETLTLSTPYFVPDATVYEALCSAAHRGVKVTLIFPKNNDSWVVAAASRSYYRKLLSAGCSIHEFTGGLLHAKTLTLDGCVTLIGSSNLDLRSFDLNYENNILLQDADITRAVRHRQDDYIASSDPVTLDEVKAWPRYRRIWNNTVATIGPVL
ncbi:cardiolipin synthase [Roseobacter sp. GAI101]|uniref:cardiolipin synthase n=1 Tax=Roseobacter sp. (strain GAI101) TaxID=391589 RepID=UPI0001871838|nr:cardiolipin synthase [Roseobacter sp. GAI101]EEB85053.1 cardiolipin synthase [Roseobacter sp. GAI101]